jgi:hypothetical protein
MYGGFTLPPRGSLFKSSVSTGGYTRAMQELLTLLVSEAGEGEDEVKMLSLCPHHRLRKCLNVQLLLTIVA